MTEPRPVASAEHAREPTSEHAREPTQVRAERLQRAREVLEQATRIAGTGTVSAAQAGVGEAEAEPADAGAAGPESAAQAGREQRRRRAPRRRRSESQESPGAAAAAQATEPDAESVARTVALNMLNHSARSRAELAEAMARKDVPGAVADRVLDRFEEVGLVDDAEYAATLVRTRQSERGLARRALALELKRKGIVGEAATEALDAVEPEDEEAAARRVVDKRLRSMSGLEPEVKRRRLLAMLARKGHPAGLSYRVVDEALRAETD